MRFSFWLGKRKRSARRGIGQNSPRKISGFRPGLEVLEDRTVPSASYTIDWANGTVWHEVSANVPNLAGAWNINGLPTQVQQNGPGLTFTNERDGASSGYFLSSTRVFASGWNLTGTVSGSAGHYAIKWANGTAWNEAAANVPNLAGAWNKNGLPTQVDESGPALTFSNERDGTSGGY